MIFCIIQLVYQAFAVSYTLNITYATLNVGNFSRRVIGANNTFPLPELEGFLGEHLTLTVINSIDEPISIHSHGLFHRNRSYYDGAMGLTQCGIMPGKIFVYDIIVQQTGSFWVHGHNSGHYVDGLRTSLVLRERSKNEIDEGINNDSNTPKPGNISKDYVVGLQDFYLKEHAELLEQYLNVANPTGAEPIPDAAMINHRIDQEYLVDANETIKLRFISMTALSMFNIWIDDHEMIIVEIDGIEVEPYVVNALSISAAQRIAVLVRTKPSSNLNYFINAEFDAQMFDGPPPEMNRVQAKLVYGSGEMFEEKSEVPDEDLIFNDDMRLVPVKKVGFNRQPTVVKTLDVDFKVYTDYINHGAFNSVPFAFPKVPALLTAMSMKEDANLESVYGSRTSTTVIKLGDVVQILINNRDANPHPFHLHGHVFGVLSKGEGEFKNSINATYLGNPMRRDTVTIPGEGYALLQFEANNPGVWFMHCHVEFHLQAGLAMQFVEGVDEIQSMNIPDELLQLCRDMDLPTSGNANGLMDLIATMNDITPFPDYMTAKGYISLAACILSAVIGFVVIVWFSNGASDKS